MAATRINLRKGTTADWTAANPVLAQAEPGVDLSTGELKVGDGTTAWGTLPHLPEFLTVSYTGTSAAVTVSAWWSLVVLTGGATAQVATLPAANSFPPGKVFTVKAASALATHSVVAPTGNIDASASIVLPAWGVKRFTSYNGTSWVTI